MKIYGPLGTAYLNMERRGDPALPACWYFELLREGAKHAFGTSLLGKVIEFGVWSCPITPYNWRKMREVLAGLGLIKLSGRGSPAVVLYAHPYLPILTGISDGCWLDEQGLLLFWAGPQQSPFRNREDIASKLEDIAGAGFSANSSPSSGNLENEAGLNITLHVDSVDGVEAVLPCHSVTKL